MISNMILRFRNLNIAQQTAIELDSPFQVKELDDQIVELWEQILVCEPETDEQTKLLVKFLLTHISNDHDNAGKNDQVRNKIMELVTQPKPIERSNLSTYADRLSRRFG